MGLYTPSFFGTTAKSCCKYNCVWQETRQDQHKKSCCFDHIWLWPQKNGVPQKGPRIFSDHFHHIESLRTWPWPETKTLRCWQMWLNARRPFFRREPEFHENIPTLIYLCGASKKNHETPKAWNVCLCFFPMPLFLPVFTQNFRYLKWRYILNLVRLFLGIFGGAGWDPYISRIHTAYIGLRIPPL